MLVQFFSIGAMVLAVFATAWKNTVVNTYYKQSGTYFEFTLFGDQSITCSGFELFLIAFWISYLGTYGIRRLLHNRALRRRESSE